MAIERVRRIGAYAPLSATYYQDDAIAEAGEAAELLFLRGLAFCAERMERDGFISDVQVTRFVGVGMLDAVDRAKRLVEVGLWQRMAGGYQIRSWLRWNKSSEELGAYRARDRERKAQRSDRTGDSGPAEGFSDGRAESETRSARNPSGVGADSDTRSDNQYTSLHVDNPLGRDQGRDPEAEPVSDPADDPGRDPASATPRTRNRKTRKTPMPTKDGHMKDPDFCRLYAAYPAKVKRPAAYVAFVKARDREERRGEDGMTVDDMVAAAERYARHPDRQRFTSHPATWLNQEEYRDQLPQPSMSPHGGAYDLNASPSPWAGQFVPDPARSAR